MSPPCFASAKAWQMCLISSNCYHAERRIVHLIYMNILSVLHHLFRKTSSNGVNTTPQQGISLSRYLGRWYEQARIENWFEAGMDYVYTDYSMGVHGSINITNNGTKSNGRKCQATGRGTLCGQGRMNVSFVPPYGWFRAPYHILYVDNEYETALVSGESNAYLWLLTRKPHPLREQLTALIKEAQQRGFDTTQLRYTRQN